MSDFRPWPKPAPLEPITKRKEIPRKGRPKAKNIPRSTAAFAENYHSRERVLWMKAQICAVCEAYGQQQETRSENAHTEISGAGLKAHYSTIVPMCHLHHQQYDEYQDPMDDPTIRDTMKKLAAKYEALWQTFGGSDV